MKTTPKPPPPKYHLAKLYPASHALLRRVKQETGVPYNRLIADALKLAYCK